MATADGGVHALRKKIGKPGSSSHTTGIPLSSWQSCSLFLVGGMFFCQSGVCGRNMTTCHNSGTWSERWRYVRACVRNATPELVTHVTDADQRSSSRVRAGCDCPPRTNQEDPGQAS